MDKLRKPRVKHCIGKCDHEVVGVDIVNGKKIPIIFCNSCKRQIGR